MYKAQLQNGTKPFTIRVFETVENLPRSKRVGTTTYRLIKAPGSVAEKYRAVRRAKSRAAFTDRSKIVKDETGFDTLDATVNVCTDGEGPPVAKVEKKRVRLCASYSKLASFQIHSLPYIKIREELEQILFCYSTINHEFELKQIDEDQTVIDHVTGLMWHRSGSSGYMNLKKARKWLQNLNRDGYAGYSNWRFPTVEEAASLLESSTERDGFFIDKLFSKKQWGTWTGDCDGRKYAWLVNFANGTANLIHKNSVSGHIRPVRSIGPQDLKHM